MEWQDKPTENGYYWLYDEESTENDLVFIMPHAIVGWEIKGVSDTEYYQLPFGPNWQFYGPLEVPTPPTVEEKQKEEPKFFQVGDKVRVITIVDSKGKTLTDVVYRRLINRIGQIGKVIKVRAGSTRFPYTVKFEDSTLSFLLRLNELELVTE